jgi:hypothetical protein
MDNRQEMIEIMNNKLPNNKVEAASEIFQIGFGVMTSMIAGSGKKITFDKFREICIGANKIMSDDKVGMLNEEEFEEAINLAWNNVKGTNG